jgi:hypothetical protein
MKKLVMKIYNSKLLKDLQKEFSQVFPYLKIEFFKTPHHEKEGSSESDIWDTELAVSEVNPTIKAGGISLEGKMLVRGFEKIMDEEFGLSVQVYRKSHGSWLQTWMTDIWTLDEQNYRGKIMGDIGNHLRK